MNVTILGSGAYGMALAKVFRDNKNNVIVWSKFKEEVISLKEKYLDITFTTDMEMAINGTDLIVIAIPVSFLEDTISSIKKIYNGQDILIASKGIDTNSLLFPYEIISNKLDNASIGVISGGTFAKDINDKKIMGITLATKHKQIKEKVKNSFETDFLKVQYVDDVIGVSVCGAVKNVMAIGFGMLDGANYPASSKFLFLTEAIYEIKSLIIALGGNNDTIMSYAGIDDIMMTCTSDQSRNYTLGSMIGKGLSNIEINNYKQNTTIEGLDSCMAIYKMATSKNIKLPIVSVIYNILYNNGDINDLVKVLEKENSI